MAKKQKVNYFDLFVNLLDFSRQAIDYIAVEIEDFDTNTLNEKLDEIHEIEHNADIAKHDLMEHLVKEFITPIEREDISEIAQMIDDITDHIEEILQKLYMYHIKQITPEAKEFVAIIAKCVAQLDVIFREFHNYKRSTKIHNAVIKLNELEEEGDKLYIDAMRKLYETSENPIYIMVWSAMYRQFENCCDICERTGNLVEEAVMKNS